MREISIDEHVSMYDTYGEAINGPALFQYIAASLLDTVTHDRGSLLVGWTDGEYSHHDVLFVHRPESIGNIQRGMRYSRWMLFVSVLGCDTFGFHCDDRNGPLHPGYVSEKLRVGSEKSVTTIALTALINGVLDQIEIQSSRSIEV